MSTIRLLYSNFNILVWLDSYPNEPGCKVRGKPSPACLSKELSVELSVFKIHTMTDTDVNEGQQSNLWIFLIKRCGPGMVLLSVFIKLSSSSFFFFFSSFEGSFWIKSLRKMFRGKLSLKVLRQDKDDEQKWISALPMFMLQCRLPG